VTIPARVSLVTLGVSDLARSRAFYESLGWETVGDADGMAFFRTGGALLSLYPLPELAADAGMSPTTRTGTSTRKGLPQIP
jgi:catechol 2,3-dioxygenase-like lactoylglutathione lyase family enzyme